MENKIDENAYFYNKRYMGTLEDFLSDAYRSYCEWSKDDPILTVEEFINKVKVDYEFASRWSINTSKVILSWEERFAICDNERKGYISPFTIAVILHHLDKWNVPTRRITLVHNNKTFDL